MKITLCGSAKFEKEFVEASRRLTLMGHTVYSLSCYPSQNGGKDWYTEADKVMLDLVHFSKMEESDLIVIVGDGYAGFSTAREVAWAKVRDKAVLPLWPYTTDSGVDWDTVEEKIRDGLNWGSTIARRVMNILETGQGESIRG